MKIYRPLKPDIKTQGFAENLACALVDKYGEVIKPYVIIGKRGSFCPIGYKEFYPLVGMKGHSGWDYNARRGEPVYFPVDVPNMKWWGEVVVDDAQGINFDVHSLYPVHFDELPKELSKHALTYVKDNKIHIKFRFTHGYKTFLEDKPKIQTGVHSDGSPQMKPEIKLGDKILLADNTGASAGDHLHWGMKATNGMGMTVGSDNGYYGGLDMSPYFENKFVLDVISGVTEDPTVVRLEELQRTYERQHRYTEASWIKSIIAIVKAFTK